MNIAIDIDDTLADSFEHFLPSAAEFMGRTDLDYMREHGISYDTMPEPFGSRLVEYARSCWADLVPSTPFKPDAAEYVQKLRDRGHKIIIITGRDYVLYEDPYAVTLEELANGKIPYDKLVCTRDKGTACEEEHIDLIIDDMPRNLTAAQEKGTRTLLFTSPANIHWDLPFERVASWPEAFERIVKMEREL